MRTILHDMRNQLAVAVANIEAFIDGKLEPTPARLSAVLQSLNELNMLIGDLRGQSDLNRETKLKREYHDTSTNICSVIANEALGVEATATQKGVAFDVHRCENAADRCLKYSCDPVRIAEVVNNVLTNAVHYTPRGGTINVDCHRGTGSLIFSVSDRGPGFSANDRVHAFENGFRGSASAGTAGSGMGLAVVDEVVTRYGGSVRILDRAGGGTTVEVDFPDDRPAAAYRH